MTGVGVFGGLLSCLILHSAVSSALEFGLSHDPKSKHRGKGGMYVNFPIVATFNPLEVNALLNSGGYSPMTKFRTPCYVGLRVFNPSMNLSANFFDFRRCIAL